MPRFDPGDYVKVEFKDELEPVGEWMWVRVESSDDDHRFVFGVLDNEPTLEHGQNTGLGTQLDSVTTKSVITRSPGNLRDHLMFPIVR
jgi:hypothetical protein